MHGNAGVEALFLPFDPGKRFVLFYPARNHAAKGAVLYVPPFGEEMNKSRRMAAVQARAFAGAGFAVLQPDLFGTGDSTGDLWEASWQLWKRDLSMARDWLRDRAGGPLHLWGLRLGAALALDWWKDEQAEVASALLWQPVLSGKTFMNQFLRTAVAADALRGGAVTTDTLRQRLADEQELEVAGYRLSQTLVQSIDDVDMSAWAQPDASLEWLEVRSASSPSPSPATSRQINAWRERQVAVTHTTIAGDSFWGTQEIVEIPELVGASLRCLAH